MLGSHEMVSSIRCAPGLEKSIEKLDVATPSTDPPWIVRVRGWVTWAVMSGRRVMGEESKTSWMPPMEN